MSDELESHGGDDRSTGAPASPGPALKKSLGPITLWALGVGYVISGEYFGWNLGLPLAGTRGMLAAIIVVTLLYVAFVMSYAELACALPRAGGAYVYASRALGRYPGAAAGVCQAIEFVFAPPAIAMAIGAYVGQRYPTVDPRVAAVAAYFVFTALNAWGVKQAASFEMFVTALAVIELCLFIGIAAPHFDTRAFNREALPHGWSGAFAALPFAIWFYLAIEGVANAAEEAKNPQRDVALGFGLALLTLVTLAVAVFFTATGIAGWRAVVYPEGSTDASDAPLPLALAHIVTKTSWLYHALLGVGLLGLVASFHGIILAAARAMMELGRSGFFPRSLGAISGRTHTPIVALATNLSLGIVAIFSGRTDEIITLSVFGALTMYAISMVSVFVLRHREPELQRPFRAPLYPLTPGVAGVLAVACLASVAVYHPRVLVVFIGLVAAGLMLAAVRHRATTTPGR